MEKNAGKHVIQLNNLLNLLCLLKFNYQEFWIYLEGIYGVDKEIANLYFLVDNFLYFSASEKRVAYSDKKSRLQGKLTRQYYARNMLSIRCNSIFFWHSETIKKGRKACII